MPRKRPPRAKRASLIKKLIARIVASTQPSKEKAHGQ
jgi:hypothetical protein